MADAFWTTPYIYKHVEEVVVFVSNLKEHTLVKCNQISY